MVFTQQKQHETLQHVLVNLFQLQADSPLTLALGGSQHDEIYKVINMTFTDIDTLFYEDNEGNCCSVLPHVKGFIWILKAYSLWHSEEGNPIGETWIAITCDNFDAYHVGEHYS